MNTPTYGGGGPLPPNRWTSAAVGGGVIAVASVICFLLPFGWLFGVPLLALAAVYVYCVATGMDPKADVRSTLGHIRAASSAVGGALPGETRTPSPPAPPTGSPPPATPTPAPAAPPQVAPTPAPAPPPVTAPRPTPPPPQPTPAPPARPAVASQPIPAPPPARTPPPAAPPSPPMYGPPVSVHSPAGFGSPLPQPGWPGTGPPAGPGAAETQAYPPYGPPPVGDSPPPRGRQRGSTGVRFLAVALVIVLLAAATVTVALVLRSADDDDRVQALPRGLLQAAYPEAPSRTFTVTQDNYNGSGTFVRPNYPIGGEESTGYLQSDKYAITGIPDGLIAIDPATGEVAWIQDSLGRLGCSDVFDDQTLGCLTDGGLVLLSAETGQVERRLPNAAGYTRLQKFGDKYAYATSGGDTATVALGTLDNPEAYWKREVAISGGTRSRLVVSDKIILWQDLSASGGWSLAYNDAGESINPTASGSGNLVGDHFVAADNAAKVYDSSGALQYEADWYVDQPDLYAPAEGIDLAFTGGSVIDPRNGRELWDMPSGVPPTDGLHADIRGVVGSVVLANTWPRVGLLAADARTGAPLWRIDSGVPPTELTTDGRRVMAIDEYGTITAYDLATGGVAWSVEAGDLGSYPKVFAVGSHLVAVGSDAMVGFTGSGEKAVLYDSAKVTTETAGNQSSGGAVTKCGNAPKVVPETFRASDGALVVRLKFTATCPGGDVISNSGYRVTIRDQSSVIASAQFNLGGSSVLALPREGGSVARDFSFPPGTYWRLPSSLSGGGGSNTSVAGSGQTVECTSEGSDTVPRGQEMPPSASGTSSPLSGAMASGGGVTVNPTQNALDALRAQANADYSVVQRDLAERWLAQISAKQVRNPPLMAVDIDDRTMVAWTPEEILRQHLALRSQYPEVRLVYSNDWSTFDLRDWWITVAQPNVADPVSANAWCDSKALAPKQCFAKLISNTRGSPGTTVYRR